ncbi:MAG TPA: N-acetylmuramoyl-L-alanine amidase-like domain-containing protein [Acidobacteriota bacterium]|nr:N-acetylmuramoyl-L-alanine amidase-like domain-containing protein [Acidobacteriota bacterium]
MLSAVIHHSRAGGRRSVAVARLALALASAGVVPSRAAEPTPASPPPADPLAALTAKPLYQFTEPEVGAYLAHLHATESDLRQRVVHLARKNLGQPYELYLLGEMPFETHDPQPLYCLAKSDCLVFTEHTLAMALSRDWTGFMRLLQRIRYRDGQIGVVTRNHFTESDWNPSNRWLARDITADLAGPRAVKFDEKIDRARFLKNRYKLTVSIPVEEHRDTFFPYAEAPTLGAQLQDGDVIEVVRGIVKKGTPVNDIFGGNAWIGHVGLVAHGPDGALHIIHSAEPKVREEPLTAFIARETAHNAERDAAGKPRLLGFKFLRLETDPLANLRQLDGPDAPRVTLPGGGRFR